MSKTKRCSKCGETKPIDDFYIDRSRPDGRTHWCKDCINLRDARYRHDNKAKVAARQKEYAKRRGNARQRERYRTDPEYRKQCLARGKAYRAANRERCRAYLAAYFQTPAGKAAQARARNKRRTRIANTENTLTAAEWQDILDEQDNCCAICGREFTDDDPPTRDHIIPVVKGGGLTRENVQALHRSCNSRKGAR